MHIVWGDGARADFDAAMRFLEAHSPAGARRVGVRILETVGLLQQFPELAQSSRHRGLRQLVVPRTPCVVIYRIHENRIEVRAVIHAKQRRRR